MAGYQGHFVMYNYLDWISNMFAHFHNLYLNLLFQCSDFNSSVIEEIQWKWHVNKSINAKLHCICTSIYYIHIIKTSCTCYNWVLTKRDLILAKNLDKRFHINHCYMAILKKLIKVGMQETQWFPFLISNLDFLFKMVA